MRDARLVRTTTGYMVAAMHRPTRLKMTDLNAQLMCVLCGGYFIDATTIIECLHSFCKSCIVRYLETSKYCPVCDVQIHKTKPLLSIRSDQTLQEIVYKLVPGLFQNEMQRRREFYAEQPQEANKLPSSGYSEERGEVDGAQRFVGCADENINFSLEYHGGRDDRDQAGDIHGIERRYLRCPAAVTVAHLKKLICAKYNLTPDHTVEIICTNGPLADDFSLMDISYIYTSRRNGQLRLYFRIYESFKRRKVTEEDNTSSPLFSLSSISHSTPKDFTKDKKCVMAIKDFIPSAVKKSIPPSVTVSTPPRELREPKIDEKEATVTPFANRLSKVSRTQSKESVKSTEINGKKLMNGNHHLSPHGNHCKEKNGLKKGEKHAAGIGEKLNGLVDGSKDYLVNTVDSKT